MEKRDEELIEAYQLGNQEAIEVLFLRYKKPIFNFALRMLANRADAEDVTGDVFLVLFSKKYTQSPQAKFSTWLYTVVRNNCIDRIRKRGRMASMWFKREKDDDYEQWEAIDPQSLPREQLDDLEMSKHVRKAIRKLPLDQREALILREYQKLSYEEISKVLGYSLEKIKILIFRARERLKGELSSLIKEDN